MSKKPEVQEKSFTGEMTAKAKVLAAAPVMVAIYLIYFGLDCASKFGPNDPTRFVFIGLPLVFGLVIVAVTGVAVFQNVTKQVVVSEDKVTFHSGKQSCEMSISKMAINPPAKALVMRSLMISDGVNFGQVYDVFLPGFDELFKTIEKRKTRNNLSAQQEWKL